MNRATWTALVVLSALLLFLDILVGPAGVDLLVFGLLFLGSVAGFAVHAVRARRRPVHQLVDDSREFDIPSFDERTIRRAVWRGVFRTAFTAFVWFTVAYILTLIVSGAWQQRGDRDTRFADVYGLAFWVAQPGYNDFGSGCCNTNLTSIEATFSLTPRIATAVRPNVDAKLELNLLGRLDLDGVPPRLPPTPVDEALGGPGPTKKDTRRLIEQLPDAVVTVAIVELREPARQREFESFLERHGAGAANGYHLVPPIFLEPVSTPLRMGRHEGTFFERRPLSWPRPRSHFADRLRGVDDDGEDASFLGGDDDESLEEFQAWAAELEESDDVNLDRLELPSSRVIKAVAKDPRVHAFIAEDATRLKLLAYLDDSAVRSVKIVDVAFDLTPDVAETSAGSRVVDR